jgi:hypothetical protein
MAAKWKRVMPQVTVGQIQAVQAKKHLTVFTRSPSAPGAGSPEQKLKFTKCAASTKGITSRVERNMTMSSCLGGRRAR